MKILLRIVSGLADILVLVIMTIVILQLATLPAFFINLAIFLVWLDFIGAIIVLFTEENNLPHITKNSTITSLTFGLIALYLRILLFAGGGWWWYTFMSFIATLGTYRLYESKEKEENVKS